MVGGRLRETSLRLTCAPRVELGFELRSLLAERLRRPAMLDDTFLADAQHRGGGARGAAELSDTSCAQYESGEAGTSTFVHVDELCLHRRELCDALRFERQQTLRRTLNGSLNLDDRGLRVTDALDLDVTFRFELAQVSEQCAGLTRQTIGFRLKPTDAVRDPPRLFLYGHAVGRLGPQPDTECEDRDAQRDAKGHLVEGETIITFVVSGSMSDCGASGLRLAMRRRRSPGR